MNRGVVVAVVAVLTLTGCESSTSTPSPAPSTSWPYPTLGPSDRVSEREDMLVDPDETETVPQWTVQSRQAALAQASAAMAAWARPDLPYEQWWSGLAGYLTPGAAEVVALTDPANIPVLDVGEARMPDEGDTAYVGWVAFDTNDGTWWVLVAWQQDGTWLVDRITRTHEVSR